MSGLSVRQGTVYENRHSGLRYLVINHNPMQLQALRLGSPGAQTPFDLGSLCVITIDDLIALRRSEEFRELGDLPPEGFQALLEALLGAPGLPEELRPFLEVLQA